MFANSANSCLWLQLEACLYEPKYDNPIVASVSLRHISSSRGDGTQPEKKEKTKLADTVRDKLQINIFKLPTTYDNVCPEVHQECLEYSQGIKCETTNEYFTEYVSADQCEVCEMRRIEAEAAAAAEEEAKKANAT
ncbi:hypothetical protein FNAPI_929 [Fusarium napiforme]|uniref:Uncharacterized protein n=1 Tax=Fusarium napiforme TaxID=42672 RepID=A0A8H5K4W0_9HYPO|nr:hypothetical protein FNAPI_929 [Fusarium napiforme]